MTTKIEKLRQQELAASENLKAQQAASDDAAAAVLSAEDAYTSDSTDRTEKQWLKVKEAEALVQLRLRSAQRKLTEATAERERAERAELEREATELRTTLDSPDPVEARLVAKEAAAYMEAAKVHVARRANNEHRQQLKFRLNEVNRLLTGVATQVWNHEFSTDPSSGNVAEELTKIAQKAHGTDPALARRLNAMAITIGL